MKIFFYLALALSLAGCSQGKNLATGSGKSVRIFYNNDNFAYLEPCGCRVSPIGGMDRRWNAMQAYPAESRVFVDAGNMLFKSTQTTEYLSPQWYEQAVGVIEAYNLLNADAATVGATDFALGAAKLKELIKGAKFPFVSANLYVKDSGELFLPDSVMIERQGKKIGIFGLYSPALPLPAELEARDPVGHAKAMIKKLKGQGADMVIALSHQGYDADVLLAKGTPGIDLLVGAHSQSLLQSPDTEGDTLIVQLSNQGQMLGMVEYEAASLPKKRTEFLVAELNNEYNESPQGLANPMKNLLAVTNLRMGEANRKLDERIWAAHKGEAAGFQTMLSCRDCHGKQTQFQDGQRHSASFLTLMAKKQEFNLDCVKCHSVGLGQKGGFKSLGNAFIDDVGHPVALGKIREIAGKDFPAPGTDYRKNPSQIRPDVAKWIDAMKKADVKKAFVSVQCENCHGPKAGHPFANGDTPAGKVATNACLQCHTKEQMPAWYDGSGKVKQAALKEAMKEVACPR